ncbi:MAG: electron transport complex subunit RsxC [Oscillospiraceae bacterium]
MNRLRGVHVDHHKNTTQSAPHRIPTPERVVIPMSQHIGAPCVPAVKIGDLVKVGQVIGEASGFVSAPIHASVSGKITALDDILLSNGVVSKAIVIASDGEQNVSETVRPPDLTDLKSFQNAVRASGLVGLGGAGFPASVKLSPKDPSTIEALIVNAAECEPYITSDLRTMIDEGQYVLKGIELVQKYLGITKVIIGIEDNKPQAIALLTEMVKGKEGITVMSLPSLYPQGGEKVLIYHTTGKIVPEGQLPMDVGVIVINVTSVAFLAKYMETGMPLVEKCLTVDGSAVAQPQNIIAPIGTPISKILEFCGSKCEPKKILMGGPMMGIAVPNGDAPLLKNNNAILALDGEDAAPAVTTDCIRCGRCVNACPLKLMPSGLERAYRLRDAKELERLHINTCMECGCCSYVCPAKRELVQSNKLAKQFLKEKKVVAK